MRNRQDRAAEYRRRADESVALVEASPLDHVREKHQVAADTWTRMAEMEERAEAEAVANQLERPAA